MLPQSRLSFPKIHQHDDQGFGSDLMYVSGRWVFDSFHEGWNEIHPIKVCTPLGTWNGAWPTDTEDRKKRADDGFNDANNPGTKANQDNQKWAVGDPPVRRLGAATTHLCTPLGATPGGHIH